MKTIVMIAVSLLIAARHIRPRRGRESKVGCQLRAVPRQKWEPPIRKWESN